MATLRALGGGVLGIYNNFRCSGLARGGGGYERGFIFSRGGHLDNQVVSRFGQASLCGNLLPQTGLISA